MTRGGILAGSDPGGPDPDKGKPHRHTRQKIRLMLIAVDDQAPSREAVMVALEEALLIVAETHPEQVLDALIKVHEERQ